MSRAFSLIELLVAVAMLLLVGTGSMVFINRFNSKKELELGRDQLTSNLRLARSYALGKQRPLGFDQELSFVTVTVDTNGKMTVGANGVGATFFEKNIFEKGVVLDQAVQFGFLAYEGKLADIDGVVATDDVRLTLKSNQGIGDTMLVKVSISGLINEQR